MNDRATLPPPPPRSRGRPLAGDDRPDRDDIVPPRPPEGSAMPSRFDRASLGPGSPSANEASANDASRGALASIGASLGTLPGASEEPASVPHVVWSWRAPRSQSGGHF